MLDLYSRKAGFWTERRHPMYAQLVRIRSVSQAGVSPPTTVDLPEFELTQPVLDPASFADFGATTTPDRRARIRGQVQCGTNEGGCSVQISVKEATLSGLTLGHATVQLGYLESRSVAVTLNHRGSRELARRRRLAVRLVTKTLGAYGPALEAVYPLTILARPRD